MAASIWTIQFVYFCLLLFSQHPLGEVEESNPPLVSVQAQAHCKDGWTYYRDSCYLFSLTEGTWEQGRQECLALGSDYVKITSLEELNFCASQLKGVAWIGLHDSGIEGDFVWISDNEKDTNSRNTWWCKEQTNRGSRDCVVFFATSSVCWREDNCDSIAGIFVRESLLLIPNFLSNELSDRVRDIKSSLVIKEEVKASLLLSQLELLLKIAEMESSSSLETRLEKLEQTINHTLDLFAAAPTKYMPRVQAYCKEGWSYFGDSCYLFSFAKGTWEEGRQDCLAMGSDYVKITSPEEYNFCASRIKYHSWIGLNDIETEGKFVWTSDGKEDTNSRKTWWGHGEPNNMFGSQDCVALYLHNLDTRFISWFDENCPNKYRYICERDPTPQIAYP